MPSQSAAWVDLPLLRQEWELLVRLPRDVLVAAAADGPHADAVAGLEAIAAGHRGRSLLVRGVVAAIFAEQQPTGPAGDRQVVLARCAAATHLVRQRLGGDEATAYGQWLLRIAASVGPAAWQNRTVRLGGVAINVAERRFVNEIATSVGHPSPG